MEPQPIDPNEQPAPPSIPPKRLYRSSDQKLFLGVAGGLAEYFDLDPTLVRILFVAGAVLGLSGVVVYVVLALIMPDEDALDLEPRLAAQRTLDQAGQEIERGVNLAMDKARNLLSSRGAAQPPPPSPSPDAPTTRVEPIQPAEGTRPAEETAEPVR